MAFAAAIALAMALAMALAGCGGTPSNGLLAPKEALSIEPWCGGNDGTDEAVGSENDMGGGAPAIGWKPLGEFRLRIERAPSMSSHERERGNMFESSSDSIGDAPTWAPPPRQCAALPPMEMGAEAAEVGCGSAASAAALFTAADANVTAADGGGGSAAPRS